MSPSFKAFIALVIGVLALFSSVVVEVINVERLVLFVHIIPFILGVVAIFLGLNARKGGAKALGIAAVTLGIIGALSHLLSLLQLL